MWTSLPVDDFETQQKTVTIAEGDSEACVDVPVTIDSQIEGKESFSVSATPVGDVPNSVVGGSPAMFGIFDDVGEILAYSTFCSLSWSFILYALQLKQYSAWCRARLSSYRTVLPGPRALLPMTLMALVSTS